MMKLEFPIVIFLVILKTVTCDFTIVSTTQRPNDELNLADVVSNNTKRLQELESQNSQLFLKTLQSMNENMVKIQKTLEKLASDKHENKHENKHDDKHESKNDFPTSCADLKEKGKNQSGVYIIKPKRSSKSIVVFCDMDVQGGGWIYFLNRYDGSQDFYLNWNDYKNGFGSYRGEFWLGLEDLHEITGSEINELLVELTDHDGVTAYARYDAFVVGSEGEGYSLKVLGKYSGTAGDSLLYQSGMKFTTKDKDQDLRPHGNCAVDEHGAYWYNMCTDSNLTSKYLKQARQAGYRYGIMYWNTFRGSDYSLKKAKMMVRPR